MKLFYFIDFLHVKKYGSPITYDTYVNLEHGPIPSTIMNLVNAVSDDLDNSLLADTIRIEKVSDQGIQRIVCENKFSDKDKKLFTNTEIEVMNEVVQRFGNKNTKYLEDASHKEAPWMQTKLSQKIPYSLAANDPDSMVSKEEIELFLSI